jgi:hypothetical protein
MPRIVYMPKCIACGTIDGVHICPVCDQFACYECTALFYSLDDYNSDTDATCTHKQYVTPDYPGWEGANLGAKVSS